MKKTEIKLQVYQFVNQTGIPVFNFKSISPEQHWQNSFFRHHSRCPALQGRPEI